MLGLARCYATPCGNHGNARYSPFLGQKSGIGILEASHIALSAGSAAQGQVGEEEEEEEASKGIMAAFLLLLAPLLLLGTAAGQADMEMDECLWLWNVTEGNFSVVITPETYQANTTYLVAIRDDRNHSSSPGPLLLQALSPQNASVGEWTDTASGSCSSVLTALLNSTESRAHWTSPSSNLSSVLIRVYLILPGNITELKTWMLSRGAETTPVPPSSTSAPSSTSSPKTTSTSNITSSPKITSTSDITSSPKITSTSDITSSPKITSTSNITSSPKTTSTSDITSFPNSTSTSNITSSPKITSTSDITSSPKITSTSNITSSPNSTSTPSSTPSSVSRAQGSSWLLAALLLLLTASLLS
ncbi:hypothetical protein RLOC_00001808 [Lonchura striata]|uniref:Placenta-expressed transcript 1 protein n=1 Tax=Lonchura striata TaxID=40157 RepID=A0A218UQ02_9PASE|nr:hypothetical protein RLOC_00001808 [Lonchura striata domestica]